MRTVRIALITATAALALAGCGKKESTTVTTTANGSTTVTTTAGGTTVTGNTDSMSAAALGIKPGKWETTMTVTDVKIANAPAGMPAMPTPQPVTHTSCLTPEQATKGPGEFMKNAKADCTSTRNVYDGGKIDVAMTCKLPGGTTMSTKANGTYSPTEMTSDAEVEMTGRMSMTQKIHTVAKRVGDCTG